MANTSLPNLTERTATANTDLIHVNSGGTDYKETKANFLSDINSSITSLNNSLANSLFVDTNNKTSYSFPVTPPGGSFGYFLLFGGTTSADTSNVFLFVGMVANGNVQFARLCGTQNFTGTISNGVCTITSSNTVWGGIRVISIN